MILLLLIFFTLSTAQDPMLAAEFFPDAAISGGGSSPVVPAPSEEELIAKLLKSGAGLPPAAWPPTNNKAGTDEAVLSVPWKSSNNRELEPAKSPSKTFPLPPSLPASPRQGLHRPSSSPAVHPPSAPPSYVQCLYRIEAKVCDPEGILQEVQKREIDQTLGELLLATRKENAEDECNRSGLELMFIIVRYSSLMDDSMSAVQRRLNDVLGQWVREPEHKCEKPVVVVLSADPSIMNRKMWSGRHWDVSITPSQLVKLFMEQDLLTKKERYSEVILNMVEGILDQFEKTGK